MEYKAAILTASDKGAVGQREDLSGPELEKLLTGMGFSIIARTVVPDEREQIASALIDLCDNKNADLILTTGGTGFSPRDITPEATHDVIHREVPGIPEAMRQESLKITNRAMLTRAIAGIRNQTLIINMPGSPKAARECFEVIRPALLHAMEILTGRGSECGHNFI
jgi:molybdenum cofactor synthesis domain-containing protein